MLVQFQPRPYNNKYMPLIKPEPKPDDNEQDFYHTIVRSPQWEAWEEEVSRRMIYNYDNDLYGKETALKVFDIPECVECDIISQEHFQEFIKFIKTI